MSSAKKIYVELTFGHRATLREKGFNDKFTHDWEVFVRSDQGVIEAFVDKVIFQLHETFQKPRRVIKEPPFCVKESGYAGFIIDIEVCFKNKDEPRKTKFAYDLFLQSNGPTINHSRKERLVFDYPQNEDFAKRLFEGGGVLRKEKDGNRSDSLVASSSSHLSPHSGGKSSKHSTNSAKASPKDSFENLFGTPIKRGGSGSPSLTSTTVWANGPTGKGGAKGERPNGSGGGKGEKPSLKSSSTEKVKASSKSPLMPSLLSPSGSEGSSSRPSSSKSSRRSSSEKRSKGQDKERKMLPPEHSAVPRKSKKSMDIFTPSPSSSTSIVETNSSGDKSKKKKKSSKHSKVKKEPDDSPERSSRKDVKKERKEKSRLSPISPSSHDASSSSASSESEANSEEESVAESEPEEMIDKSNKRIAAANSTSSSKRRSTQLRHSESESDSDDSPPPRLSPASSPCSSSASSGIPSPPPKRRKSSNSSSSRTPDQHHARSESPMEKPNSSSSVKVKKEGHHHKRNEDEKRNRKSRKKSKKHKKKVFEEEHSDSSVSSVESYASPPLTNGITSNCLSLSPAAFTVPSSSGTFTLEMGLLQDLHGRITSLADPEKLQEVVEIVMDSGGQDQLWSMESGLSFDFDLCKLSPTTIKKIQEAISD